MRHVAVGSLGRHRRCRSSGIQVALATTWLFLNEDGREQADTYDSSVADALHQAAAEFGVQPHEWTVLLGERSDA
jgi:hypothetical protein